MPCYHPIPAYQDARVTPDGEVKRNRPQMGPRVKDTNLQLPCGSCLGCRTARATEWGIRATHEAAFWEHNCFLTLTYNDESLPHDGQLEPRALQLFLKKLRRAADRAHPALARDPHSGLRYLASGEYGEHNGRPHYHLCLFNCSFTDTHPVAGDLVESPLLQQLWPAGQHRLGSLTSKSAAYVAKYTVKNESKATTLPNGVKIQIQPFLRMSLKPAIGTQWIKKYKTDLQHGYLVTNGYKGRIPRHYKNALERDDPGLMAGIQQRAADYAARTAPAGPQEQQRHLTETEKIHTSELNKRQRKL